MLAHDRLDGLAGLVGVIEGNRANIVVQHVRLDDTVEERASNEAEFAVNSCGSTTNVVPATTSVVGKRWVGVLEESDGNEPVVYPEVWKEVPDEHVVETIGLAERNENTDGNCKTGITKENKLGVFGLVKWTRWVEVVDAGSEAVDLAHSTSFRLLLVVVVASDVSDEVQRPAQKLLANGVNKGGDWSLLGQLVDLMDHLANSGGIIIASLGNEDHITLHVSGGLVVLSVGDLPGEVRDQESRVADQAGSIVENLGWRERLVAALVCKNPETSSEKPLDDGVDSPQRSTNWCEGDVLWSHEVVEKRECDGETADISSDVSQATKTGALEAVLRNGISDIVDSIVWKLELVAICVQQLAI